MVVSVKPRNVAHIINKAKHSEKFKMFLAAIQSSENHFTTTLNRNPLQFMRLYNDNVMKNTTVTADQQKAGLTNNIKLSLYMLNLLVSEHFAQDQFFTEIGLLDHMINYQIHYLELSGLRFIEEEKTTMMAAVWYSWFTSRRLGSASEDLANSFLDILWLFLEPVGQAKSISFDRQEFQAHIEGYIMTRKQETEVQVGAPEQVVLDPQQAAAAPKNDRIPFQDLVQFTLETYANNVVANGEVKSKTHFANFLNDSHKATSSVIATNEAMRWLSTSFEGLNLEGLPFLDENATVGLFSMAAQMPSFIGLHNEVLTVDTISTVLQTARTSFEKAGFVPSYEEPLASAEICRFTNFVLATQRQTQYFQIDKPIRTRGELHLRIGMELMFLSEILAKFFALCYENKEQKNASPTMVVSLTTAILDVLKVPAKGILEQFEIGKGMSPQAASTMPDRSLFKIGASKFVKNIQSIITKEIEMSDATVAKSVQDQAQQTIAEAPARVSHDAELAIRQLMGDMEKTVTESMQNVVAASERRLMGEMDKLSKRVADLEIVAAKTTIVAGKGNVKDGEVDDSMAALERIRATSKEIVKSEKKKDKKKKNSGTGYHELSTVEKVAVYGGGAVAVTAVGYGAYRLGSYLLDEYVIGE